MSFVGSAPNSAQKTLLLFAGTLSVPSIVFAHESFQPSGRSQMKRTCLPKGCDAVRVVHLAKEEAHHPVPFIGSWMQLDLR